MLKRCAYFERLTFVADHGRIVRFIYPVPPDGNANEVLARLEARA